MTNRSSFISGMLFLQVKTFAPPPQGSSREFMLSIRNTDNKLPKKSLILRTRKIDVDVEV